MAKAGGLVKQQKYWQSYTPITCQWREELGGGQFEWRGKVQRILNGEAYYFRTWRELLERLEQLAAEVEGN